MELPFTVGEKKWLPGRAPWNLTIPCSVCAGQKAVTVILGSGEQLRVPCEGCGLGYDGPRGYISEWSYAPRVEEFIIQEPVGLYNGEWTVKSTAGTQAKLSELKDTEDLAMQESCKQASRQFERCMETWQRKRKDSKHLGWTIRYHRDKIADLQRQIAWHQEKILAKEEPKG